MLLSLRHRGFARPPVSIGGFWAAPTPVVRQPGNLGMNAQFARVAAPLVPPKEGEPLWIGIGRFGRLGYDWALLAFYRTDVVEFGAGPALSLQLLWRR